MNHSIFFFVFQCLCVCSHRRSSFCLASSYFWPLVLQGRSNLWLNENFLWDDHWILELCVFEKFENVILEEWKMRTRHPWKNVELRRCFFSVFVKNENKKTKVQKNVWYGNVQQKSNSQKSSKNSIFLFLSFDKATFSKTQQNSAKKRISSARVAKISRSLLILSLRCSNNIANFSFS